MIISYINDYKQWHVFLSYECFRNKFSLHTSMHSICNKCERWLTIFSRNQLLQQIKVKNLLHKLSVIIHRVSHWHSEGASRNFPSSAANGSQVNRDLIADFVILDCLCSWVDFISDALGCWSYITPKYKEEVLSSFTIIISLFVSWKDNNYYRFFAQIRMKKILQIMLISRIHDSNIF